MTETKIPQTDSIEELAQFWQAHDLTDFEDELEEVTEAVFAREYEHLWNEQIERDVSVGRLDVLLEQVDEEYDAGLSKPL